MVPILVLVLLGIVAGGCSAGEHTDSNAAGTKPSAHSGAATGTLTGQVKYIGGPPPGLPRPVARGTVTLAGPGQAEAVMFEQGRFSVQLKPGVYKVSATSPDYNSGDAACDATHPARVTAGQATSVHVICQVR
jgi:hypothetical protein